jgi:hypothetical protein
MTKRDVLRATSFGQQVSEHEVDELSFCIFSHLLLGT